MLEFYTAILTFKRLDGILSISSAISPKLLLEIFRTRYISVYEYFGFYNDSIYRVDNKYWL